MLLLLLVAVLDDGSNVTVSTQAGGPWTGTDGGALVFSHEYSGEDRNASLETRKYNKTNSVRLPAHI